MDCVDINECFEKPNICQNGECKNLQGSFQCICNVGYLLTSTRDNCIDIDECQRHPNICNNGMKQQFDLKKLWRIAEIVRYH